MKHARMAFHAADSSRSRLELIGKDDAKYTEAVQQAIELQQDMTDKFFAILDSHMYGRDAKKFLEELHRHYMKDVGKRNLVISRLNQDLDCVEIGDPAAPGQINNTPTLIDLYKRLCTCQQENELDP